MQFDEQTAIAKKLGISNNAFKRMAQAAKLKHELIDNKRNYDWDEVIEVIMKAKKGE